MKNSWKALKNNLFMLKYVVKYVPGLVVYNILRRIFSGFLRVFTNIYAATYILDSVQKGRSMGHMAAFLIFIVGGNVLCSILDAYYTESFFLKRKELLYQKMHSELFEKARQIELSRYDDPEFYNNFVWAMAQSDGKALEVLDTAGNLFWVLTQMTTILGILISIDWKGILFAVLAGFWSLLLQMRINKKEFKRSEEQLPLQRKRDYTSRVLYLSDYAKEIRLSDVKGKLVGNFSETNRDLVGVIRRYGTKLFGLQALDEVGNSVFIMNGLYLSYLLYLALVKKSISYGGFYGLYQGTGSLQAMLQRMGGIFSQLQKHSLYIERFRGFLEYEPKMEKGGCQVPSEGAALELKQVSFRYEGAGAEALHDIDLTIRPGEKLALVGYNGAGKSTLVKLIMRLYDPTGGQICLDGRDIKEFKEQDYHQYFGVVFQDFKLFAATIAENVKMDRVTPKDEPVIYEALEKSDFTGKLKQLDKGIYTALTREFSKEGVNLSGGEAQKVAIARVFPKDCRIVILDEPSSALDPVSEYYVNQAMLAAAGDKTVVFISHRLSTTRLADRIIMLEGGRIIEEGSHEELMALDGKYARMFRVQAENYQQSGC